MRKDPYQHADNRVLLAPLAGVTDAVFRLLCREQGAGLCYTEMVSAKGLLYNNEKTEDLLFSLPGEGRIGVQIFGSDPQVMGEAASRISEELNDKLALIDINMGCPVRKIVSNGEGSALMLSPEIASKVIRAVKENTNYPVTVKFRAGFSDKDVNAVSFGKMAEDAGADGVTVHGRTREQMYAGKADWDIIAKVKHALHIPVNGNGDIFTGQDALRMMEQTGCDGVMVARGSQGNPFVFADILSCLSGQGGYLPSPAEKRKLAVRQLKMSVELWGEDFAVRKMRGCAAWYIKGTPGAAALRDKLVRATSARQLEELLLTGLD